MAEEWRKIEGYELYEVSNFGRVRSNQKNKCVILKPSLHRGYCSVALYNNIRRSEKVIHRLVAEAFIPNPENKPQVNHKDGNKQNNVVENLEWVTEQENVLHAHRILNKKFGMTGKHHSEETKDKLRMAKLNSKLSDETKGKIRESAKKLGNSPHAKKVKNIDTGEIFDCVTEAGKKYGNRRNISLCCLGKRKTCGGYHWEYVD